MRALVQLEPSIAAKITDHQRVIALRNILIHCYSRIDDEIVWDIAQSYLPTLINEDTILLERL